MISNSSFRIFSVSTALCILIIGFSCGIKSSSKKLSSNRTTWSHYGGSQDQSKFFYTSQITKKNVNQLAVAWTYPADDNGFLMFSPIVIDTMKSCLVGLEVTHLTLHDTDHRMVYSTF